MRNTPLLCALLIIAINAGVGRAMAQDAQPPVESKGSPAYQNEVRSLRQALRNHLSPARRESPGV